MRPLLAWAWAVIAAVGFAQEYRATLLGVVTDPTGAAVRGARVTVTNVETAVRATTEANAEGNYLVPYLLPGTYRLRVEHPGFKTFERGPIELRVNDRTRVDVALEVGNISDNVTVTAEAPLVEAASSSRGQVIDNRMATNLPLSGKNPFALMMLADGVLYYGSALWSSPRPFDNSIAVTINGGRSLNEYQIDGMPNNATFSGGSYPSSVPPLEATQEAKVQTNTYDAQYGNTSGGVVNISVKSGTNKLHGAGYEYLRRTALEANQFANNASGKPRPLRLSDQYGFELDGPVTIPKLYQGKSRTFFLFALEQYRDKLPRPNLGAVPTAEQRAGDFSQTFNASGQLYKIYDPLTIQANPAFDPSRTINLGNLRYLRSPSAGNRVPKSRMEPIASRVLQDIPLPNQPGNPITHTDNWFAGGATANSNFRNLVARLDHTVNDTWKVYGRWSHSYRDGGNLNRYEWTTAAAHQDNGGRRADGVVVDAVGTLSPTMILSFRSGFNRFEELSLTPVRDIGGLGLPKSLLSQLPVPDRYPQFKFDGYIQTSLDPGRAQPSESYTLQGTLTKIAGAHSMKAGAEFRLLHYADVQLANGNGSFQFGGGWTSSNPEVADAAAGNAIASFLLGYMNSASVTQNVAPYLSRPYWVLFWQDDWQVNRRLSLNLGLRWDYEAPWVERFNRQNRGFDFAAASPYQAPGLKLGGGMLFAGVGGQPRGAFDPDHKNVQPRFGLAYRLLNSRPLVFRGGFGRVSLPTIEYGGTTGFSQTTTAQTSTPDYLPFAVLSNPFPYGLIAPAGASLGLSTQVGDAASFSDVARRIPTVWQYSAGFQFEPMPGLLLDASYVGSQTFDLQVARQLNFLTVDQLALGTPYLSQAVPNPFWGVLPVSTPRGAQQTIQRRGLLTQFPQYTSLTANNMSLGGSWYNSAQFRAEKRLSHGLSFLATYTISKTMEAVSFRNPQDAKPSREFAAFDLPQRLVLNGIYDFPVGPGRRWMNKGVAAHLIGGWSLGCVGTLQSGPPVPYPSNYNLNGDPKLDKSQQSLKRWFNTSLTLWTLLPPDSLRVLPSYSPDIRRHTAPQLDVLLSREIRLVEGHRLQFRASAYNATNTPIFGFPNTTPTSPLFGVVPIVQANQPRGVELGFRYFF
ncbi:MAG: carboxypeptidase regulatory-like domain-containing protein [Acidobacteria bacterium]|nr:carboxypeptidase regulatory-like domain-containing protein [Acidobacteriota bacterium]